MDIWEDWASEPNHRIPEEELIQQWLEESLQGTICSCGDQCLRRMKLSTFSFSFPFQATGLRINNGTTPKASRMHHDGLSFEQH
jgi:hypothetical protein